MKRILSLLLALLLLFGAACAEDAPQELTKDIVILFTADIHCGIDDGWGLAGLDAVRDYYAKDNHVFLVDVGDAIQGDACGLMTSGEAVIDLMNGMGFIASVPGNHEFDYGMERFFELAEKADFPYLSVNFTRNGEQVFPSCLMVEAENVKIALLGICSVSTIRTSTPAFFRNDEGELVYGFMDDEDGSTLCAAVQKAADDARAEGADYVIALSHMGIKAEDKTSKASDVIMHTSGIDAFLDGHGHDTEQLIFKNLDGEEVIRSAAGTRMEHIGLLRITKDGEISSQLLSWNAPVGARELLGLDNDAAQAVEKVLSDLDSSLEEVVARSDTELCIHDPAAVMEDGSRVRIIRQAETNLGDICTDAFLAAAEGADFAFINSGGIREPIEAGEITLGEVVRTLPFLNNLMVIELSGQQVLDALEWSVHTLPEGDFGGFVQVSGLTFAYDEQIPSPVVEDENHFFDHVDETMERRVRNVMVGDEPLDPEKKYRMAATDYHVYGGDGYTMYAGGKVYGEPIGLACHVLTAYLQGKLGGVVGAEYADPYGHDRMVSVHADEP